MVGTAQASAGGTPGSGVDFTEYSLDGADPVRFENTEDDDPFESSFTVSAPGDHTVEYRSTDNAGNIETTKSVEFEIGAQDPDAPTVRGAADPASGAAPLLVQFSASGRDPQNRPLIYQWDFGDDHGSANQTVQHTYTRPGRYTATVTVTDEQNKTGTDTVEVEVTAAGNRPPVVTAVRQPEARGGAARRRLQRERASTPTATRATSSTCGTSVTADRTPTGARSSTRTGRRATTRRRSRRPTATASPTTDRGAGRGPRPGRATSRPPSTSRPRRGPARLRCR